MTIEEAQHIIDTTKSWTLKRDMQKFIKRERKKNGQSHKAGKSQGRLQKATY